MVQKILPTITTITPGRWREKLKEVKELGLKEVALFPTCLILNERKELYLLLEESGIQKIPFVHLRRDMEPWEFDLLIKNYQTKVFNTHTQREFSIPADWKKYRRLIYIENTYGSLDEKEIREFAGVCIDFSHLENSRQFYPDVYQRNIKVIEKYPCGCNHVGPAKNFSFRLDTGLEEPNYQGAHFLKDLSELDYLKKYPKKYFSPYLAIELEDDLATQLKAKEYLLTFL